MDQCRTAASVALILTIAIVSSADEKIQGIYFVH